MTSVKEWPSVIQMYPLAYLIRSVVTIVVSVLRMSGVSAILAFPDKINDILYHSSPHYNSILAFWYVVSADQCPKCAYSNLCWISLSLQVSLQKSTVPQWPGAVSSSEASKVHPPLHSQFPEEI